MRRAVPRKLSACGALPADCRSTNSPRIRHSSETKVPTSGVLDSSRSRAIRASASWSRPEPASASAMMMPGSTPKKSISQRRFERRLHLLERGRDVALLRPGCALHEQSNRPGSRKFVSCRDLHQLLGKLTASVRISDDMRREAGAALGKCQRQRVLQGIRERKACVEGRSYAAGAARQAERRRPYTKAQTPGSWPAKT